MTTENRYHNAPSDEDGRARQARTAAWRRNRGTVVLGIAAALAALAAAAPSVASVSPEEATLQHVRQISGRFHAVMQAEAAGYVAPPDCVSAPGLGGMGYHYFKPGLLDTTLDIEHPEVVLYVSKANGERRLVAVEYVVADADQDLATTDDRPILAGHPFDGPMPGHFPGMPIHYELHVWAWEQNENGAFAPWNPAITCP